MFIAYVCVAIQSLAKVALCSNYNNTDIITNAH